MGIDYTISKTFFLKHKGLTDARVVSVIKKNVVWQYIFWQYLMND